MWEMLRKRPAMAVYTVRKNELRVLLLPVKGSTTELHLHFGLFWGSSHALHPALLMSPDRALTTSEACRWCLLTRLIMASENDKRERDILWMEEKRTALGRWPSPGDTGRSSKDSISHCHGHLHLVNFWLERGVGGWLSHTDNFLAALK